MKRTAWTTAIFFLIASTFLAAQNASDEEYIKAMQQTDPCAKIQALKTWLGKYAGKGAQYENFANAWICLTPCASKTAPEAIQHGEKALALGGIDDSTKVQIISTVATLYSNSGQAAKAKAAAQQLIDLAKANKDKDPSQASAWNKIIGAGYYLQAQASEKAKEYGAAAESYIASYNILKDPKIAAQLKKLGKTLYDNKQFAEAEQIYRAFYASAKDPESAIILGQTLYRGGKTEEALGIFREAYAKKRSGELAYNIGIILAKQANGDASVNQEAINFLLEASFLYPAQAQNAMNLAQGLYFTANKDVKYNEIVSQIQAHGKTIEDLTKSFNTKFGGKDEEDLSEDEKKEMKKILDGIETEKQTIKKLEADQKVYIERFNQLVAQVKTKLGK